MRSFICWLLYPSRDPDGAPSPLTICQRHSRLSSGRSLLIAEKWRSCSQCWICLWGRTGFVVLCPLYYRPCLPTTHLAIVHPPPSVCSWFDAGLLSFHPSQHWGASPETSIFTWGDQSRITWARSSVSQVRTLWADLFNNPFVYFCGCLWHYQEFSPGPKLKSVSFLFILLLSRVFKIQKNSSCNYPFPLKHPSNINKINVKTHTGSGGKTLHASLMLNRATVYL